MEDHSSPFQEEGRKIIKTVEWDWVLRAELDVCLPQEAWRCVWRHMTQSQLLQRLRWEGQCRIPGLPGNHGEPSPGGREDGRGREGSMASRDSVEVMAVGSDTVRLGRALSAWQGLWPQNYEDLLPSEKFSPAEGSGPRLGDSPVRNLSVCK